jgi:L-iditol 2-dehydrogenase
MTGSPEHSTAATPDRRPDEGTEVATPASGRSVPVLRLHGRRDLRLAQEPIPIVAPGQVLLRVTAVGLCGSDRHWFEDASIGDAHLAGPLVLGHELAGVIASGPRTGERAAIDPAIPCEACRPCRAGRANLCLALKFAGHAGTDGGLRQWMAWPEQQVHALPDGCSDAEGALLEPLGVAIHALDLAQVSVGDTVAVVGCGPIGLLLVQLARLAGARWVGATDPLGHRLEAAAGFGAATFPADGARDPATEMLAAAGNGGVDVTFEAAGSAEAVQTAIRIAGPGTRVVVVGIPSDDRLTFRASTARRKELTILLARRMLQTYPRAIDLVERHSVDLSRLVTHRFPLQDATQAFATLERRDGIKVLVEPAGQSLEPGA